MEITADRHVWDPLEGFSGNAKLHHLPKYSDMDSLTLEVN